MLRLEKGRKKKMRATMMMRLGREIFSAQLKHFIMSEQGGYSITKLYIGMVSA
jgi:hypothetical protein